jgi:hypothetical protein
MSITSYCDGCGKRWSNGQYPPPNHGHDTDGWLMLLIPVVIILAIVFSK